MGPSSRRLVTLCRASNRIPWWTQGAGSNISVKDDDTLYIKASGKRLSEVIDPSGISTLSLSALQLDLRQLVQQSLPATEADSRYRERLAHHLKPKSPSPSMETAMHALLPGREVVHLHSLVAIALAEQMRNKDPRAEALLRAAGLRVVRVPVTMPGWALAQAVAESPPADALLLANHGLVLQGDDAQNLLATWQSLEDAWCAQFDASGVATRAAQPDAMAGSWLLASVDATPTLPDVAVFLDAVLAATEMVDKTDHADQRCLRPSGIDRHASAVELWAAHVALSQMVPSLPTLSREYVQQVSGLPQEQLRRARMTRDTR